jgi:hypothetical protein
MHENGEFVILLTAIIVLSRRYKLYRFKLKKRDHFGDGDIRGRFEDNLKMNLKERRNYLSEDNNQWCVLVKIREFLE